MSVPQGETDGRVGFIPTVCRDRETGGDEPHPTNTKSTGGQAAGGTQQGATPTGQPRIVQVRQQVLKKNDVLARELRERYRRAGVFVVSLVSSPGAGKTTFLRETLKRLVSDFKVAALVGDLATENDAIKLAESGAPTRQIVTGTVCHLEAEMVERATADAGWALDELDFLFVENVGNLVCPASYDLGEDLRVVLLSTTEGEDKPLKYLTIFNTADMAIVTKSDIAGVVGFDRPAALAAIDSVRPGLPVLELSSKSGAGMDAWMELLHARRAGKGTLSVV